MKFSEILRELREEKGLSQKQLSNIVGISQSSVAKWELSKVEPSAGALITLANFFGITVGQLLGVESN